MQGCGTLALPDVCLSWGEGTLRLSDVAFGGVKLAGGGVTLRLASHNLGVTSRAAGGLFILDFLPLPNAPHPPSAFFSALLEHHARIVTR